MRRSPRVSRRTRCVLASLLAGCGLHAQAQVAFPVAFDAAATSTFDVGERAALSAHLQAAGQQWVAVLDLAGPRSLEILVVLDEVAPRSGGASVTTAFVGRVGGRDLYEQGAAAELRTGIDPNGIEPDIRISINSTYLRDELWFDPDPVARVAPVDLERTDAMSVALHELGHALAYNGWADGAGVPPAEFWSTFDRWMLTAALPVRFDGPQVLRAWGLRPDLTTGNIHHWANGPAPRPDGVPLARTPAWHDGRPVPGLACAGLIPRARPATLAATAARGNLPPGLIYELMNGVVFYRGSRYEISPLDVAALADAGLPVVVDSLFFDGFETPR